MIIWVIPQRPAVRVGVRRWLAAAGRVVIRALVTGVTGVVVVLRRVSVLARVTRLVGVAVVPGVVIGAA